MRTLKLWLDDMRTPPDDTWKWCPHVDDAFTVIRRWNGCTGPSVWEAISFDHDMGGNDTTRPVLLWMIEKGLWPQHCYVHTANPVGHEWLTGMIDRYMPENTTGKSPNPNRTWKQ